MKRMRGSVLVEAVLALSFVVIPAIAVQFELIRTVWNRVVLQVSAFQFVRHRALGSSKAEAIAATRELTAVLLKSEKWQTRRLEHWEDGLYPSKNEVWSRVQVRYRTWFPFLQRQVQVTESCRFSW